MRIRSNQEIVESFPSIKAASSSSMLLRSNQEIVESFMTTSEAVRHAIVRSNQEIVEREDSGEGGGRGLEGSNQEIVESSLLHGSGWCNNSRVRRGSNQEIVERITGLPWTRTL